MRIHLSLWLLCCLLAHTSHAQFDQHHSLGKLLQHQPTPQGFTAQAQGGYLRVQVFAPTVLRIQISQKAVMNDFSYSVITQAQNPKFALREDANTLTLATDSLQLQIGKDPLRVRLLTLQGKVLQEDDDFGTLWQGEEVSVYKRLQDKERFVGLGEKTGNLDRRGTAYTNWNNDHFAYETDADPLYVSIPFYIGIHPAGIYGFFLDNSFKTHFNFGASNDRFTSITAEAGEMDYYLIHRSSIAAIIEDYTALTGRMPLPPKWSLGYHQSRWGYYPSSEVRRIAQTFREKRLPIDAIHLDINYMDAYKVFTWHPQDFGDYRAMLQDLKDMGIKSTIIIDPGVKIEQNYKTFESGKREDIFVKYPNDVYFTAQVWPGWCHFPDFTMPKAREWWGKQFADLTRDGVRGFWNDMNEIASWGNALPNLMVFDFEGKRSTTRQARNVYGMQMSRATYEGTKALLQRRPFVLTRAGFAGVQRYTAVWTGDNRAEDDHMMAGIRLVNSMGLSGLSFVGYDVGGFAGDASPNLYARWFTLGAFTPFFRAHAEINSRMREPWTYNKQVEQIARTYLGYRYRLMPYLYSTFYHSSQSGIPVQRSLVLQHPYDDLVYEGRFQHQYLFGQDLLVAPCESTKEIIEVYLPKGSAWYNLYDNRMYTGGQVILEKSPIARIPVFVRAGAIIPMQSLVQHTDQAPSDTLDLHIYQSKASSTMVYYEDNGDNYDYEQGKYFKRSISLNPNTREIIFTKAEGTYTSAFRYVRVWWHGFSDAQPKLGNAALKIQKAWVNLWHELPQAATNLEVPTTTLPHTAQEIKIKY